MTTTQLTLYNGALRLLGERKLASTSEDRKPRYVLDDIWADGFVDYILERGLWNFAIHTIKMDYDTSVTPAFGFRRVFSLPSDFIRTYAVAQDEYFTSPLLAYTQEDSIIYTDLDIIFVKYTSNDASRGADLTRWPQTVVKYAQSELAFLACPDITQSDTKQDKIEKDRDKRLVIARSESAMESPTKFPARGSWSTARTNRWGRERGNKNQLIG